MSVGLTKGAVTYRFDFWFRGRRWRGTTWMKTKGEALLVERQIKLGMRREDSGVPAPTRMSPQVSPRPVSMRLQSLYVMRLHDHVKIGLAVNVRERVRELQIASPAPIRLMAKFACMNERHERALHARFGHLRRRGEWFRYTPEVRAFLDVLRANRERAAELILQGAVSSPPSPDPLSATPATIVPPARVPCAASCARISRSSTPSGAP